MSQALRPFLPTSASPSPSPATLDCPRVSDSESDPDPDPDPDPEPDIQVDRRTRSEQQTLKRSRLKTAETYTTRRFTATDPIVFRKSPVDVPYNLCRGSAIVRGEQVDGSSVGDSPVVMPFEDAAVFDARAFLLKRLRENPHLELRAVALCDRYGIHLHALIHDGPPEVTWMDSGTERSWRSFGDRKTYPILKALFARQSFVILYDVPGCGIVNGEFETAYFERLLELEAIAKSAIVTPEGLLVAAPHRLYFSVLLLVLALCAAAVTLALDDRPSIIERLESAIFVLALVLLTIPGLLSVVSAEPNLVRNSIRGKMTLSRQSEVTRYFRLSRRDYAMLATRTRGSKLVSRDIGCFLTGDERGTHMGDEPVVQCEDLAPFGVICGQSVHYRTNWQSVCISNRLGENQTHLTNEAPRVKYWCAGVRHNTWVGLLRPAQVRKAEDM